MRYTAKAVKAACNGKLSELFPGLPVYGNTVLDGYKRPGFFTELLVFTLSRPGRYQYEYGYSYIITLLEVTHDEAYCLGVLDTIRQGFGSKLTVSKGKALVIQSIDQAWIDEREDVMQVTVNFYAVPEIGGRTEDGDIMEDVEVTVNTLTERGE
jgi:hypothetical protein